MVTPPPPPPPPRAGDPAGGPGAPSPPFPTHALSPPGAALGELGTQPARQDWAP
jgi:hypothetical protein